MSTDDPGRLASPLTEQLGPVPARWYVVDADGLATLCKDEADARESAAGYWSLYPRRAPYRAVLLGDAATARARIAELEAADEGARVAYGHLSAQKRTLERDCTHLRGLLDDAHAQIRRQAELRNSRA